MTIEQAIDIKTNKVCQVCSLAQKINTYCPCGHWSMSNNIEGQKNFKIEKTLILLPLIIVIVVIIISVTSPINLAKSWVGQKKRFLFTLLSAKPIF